VTIATLDGDVPLDFDPGTQPGELRVLRGRGMPVLQGFGRGDHRVLVNVLVPRLLTDEQRRLLAEFDSHVDDQTYKPDEGFLKKIKSAFR
jgi:molecular chaperone DnaJ